MNAAHLHLLINHLPIIGIPLVGVLLAWGLVTKQAVLQRAALTFLVLLAIATIPIYLGGEPAEEIVEAIPGVSEVFLERHEELARWAFIATELLGLLALGGLLVGQRRPTLAPRIAAVALSWSALAVALLAATAYFGGQIRHEEIRAAGVDVRAGDDDWR